MIERYAIHSSIEQLIDRFGIEQTPGYESQYNAAPAKLLPVITHQSPQGFSYFYWGTAPQWTKNKPVAERIINTRIEWLQEKPVLRKALMQHRCIIPANGFYVWKRIGKKSNVPCYFMPAEKLFSFAGIWEEYEDAEGDAFHTFSILTMPASELVAAITDRMPVMLDKQQEAVWLNPQATEADLWNVVKPYTELSSYTVSPAVFTPGYNKPSLVLPAPAADQHGNLTLFD
ncbi:MAG: SOS response-associated peptidase [Cyclobacteriaceae bacterium]|nr:SOS response-associated peptidase [Cyclobacteriaceae bacterium]